MGGRPFRLGVDTALALCIHSLTFVYVDVSMRSHRVKTKGGKLLTNQTTVIVDKTIKATLVRAAEHVSEILLKPADIPEFIEDFSNVLSLAKKKT
jgi:hypothetical protein